MSNRNTAVVENREDTIFRSLKLSPPFFLGFNNNFDLKYHVYYKTSSKRSEPVHSGFAFVKGCFLFVFPCSSIDSTSFPEDLSVPVEILLLKELAIQCPPPAKHVENSFTKFEQIFIHTKYNEFWLGFTDKTIAVECIKKLYLIEKVNVNEYREAHPTIVGQRRGDVFDWAFLFQKEQDIRLLIQERNRMDVKELEIFEEEKEKRDNMFIESTLKRMRMFAYNKKWVEGFDTGHFMYNKVRWRLDSKAGNCVCKINNAPVLISVSGDTITAPTMKGHFINNHFDWIFKDRVICSFDLRMVKTLNQEKLKAIKEMQHELQLLEYEDELLGELSSSEEMFFDMNIEDQFHDEDFDTIMDINEEIFFNYEENNELFAENLLPAKEKRLKAKIDDALESNVGLEAEPKDCTITFEELPSQVIKVQKVRTEIVYNVVDRILKVNGTEIPLDFNASPLLLLVAISYSRAQRISNKLVGKN
eukprot:TRINITY_DN1913_c0_g1_i1.p1 TRINITY_DN1913_c0_g1~~TRINITY_DN1913_c0_g1_i1.p1  ORF type:complete len:474 (-),score=137.24 TRINITY_DN1913_c0_g1_i1:237-1658(-)